MRKDIMQFLRVPLDSNEERVVRMFESLDQSVDGPCALFECRGKCVDTLMVKAVRPDLRRVDDPV